MGVAKYRLTKTNDGGFQFSLFGPSGRVIATSETYRSKTAAVNAIGSLRKAAPSKVIDDQTPTRNGTPKTPVPAARAARVSGKAKAVTRKPAGRSNGRATAAATAKPTARRSTATSAPPRKAAAKKAAPAKKIAVARKAPAKKAAAVPKAPARTPAAKKAAVKKASATKGAAKKRSGR